MKYPTIFEIRLPDGTCIKIQSNGDVTGLPKNTVVINGLRSRMNYMIGIAERAGLSRETLEEMLSSWNS